VIRDKRRKVMEVELKNSYRTDEEAGPNMELEAQIEPLHDNVFCRLDATEEMIGGIFLPDMSQGKKQEATVVAAGPGLFSETGELIPCTVKAGDRVLLSRYGGTEESIDGVKYSVVKDRDILCRINAFEVEEAV